MRLWWENGSLEARLDQPILNIIDSGKIQGSGYVPYDDEGTKATETYLIKDGIFRGKTS